jgi:hypothetical protein
MLGEGSEGIVLRAQGMTLGYEQVKGQRHGRRSVGGSKSGKGVHEDGGDHTGPHRLEELPASIASFDELHPHTIRLKVCPHFTQRRGEVGCDHESVLLAAIADRVAEAIEFRRLGQPDPVAQHDGRPAPEPVEEPHLAPPSPTLISARQATSICSFIGSPDEDTIITVRRREKNERLCAEQ